VSSSRGIKPWPATARTVSVEIGPRSYEIASEWHAAQCGASMVESQAEATTLFIQTKMVAKRVRRAGGRASLTGRRTSRSHMWCSSGEATKSVDISQPVAQAARAENRSQRASSWPWAEASSATGRLADDQIRARLASVQVPTHAAWPGDRSVGGKVGHQLPTAKKLSEPSGSPAGVDRYGRTWPACAARVPRRPGRSRPNTGGLDAEFFAYWKRHVAGLNGRAA